jgi:hypothetical protein
VSTCRESETQQIGVAPAGHGRAVQENSPGVTAELLRLQRVAGNKAVGQLIGRGRPVSVQRRIEAYQRSDFSKTRVVDASEALKYLTDTAGSELTDGQLEWLVEVTQRLRPKTLEQGISELVNASAVMVEFEDGTRNSAAVALLWALGKLGGPVVAPLAGVAEAEPGLPVVPDVPAVENVPSSSGSKQPGTKPLLTPKERRELKAGATKLPPQKPELQRPRKHQKFVPMNIADLADDTADFKKLPQNGMINPSRVKFSQDTAGFWYSNKFKFGSRDIETIEAHAQAMRETKDGGSTPAIEIVLFKRRIMTLNNRRLKAHQLAGVDIPYFKSTTYTRDADIERHPNVDSVAPRNNLTLR